MLKRLPHIHITVAGLFALATACFGQSNAAAISEVRSWAGTLSANMSDSNSSTLATRVTWWSLGSGATGTVHLDEASPGLWSGTYTSGSASVNYKIVETNPDCTVTTTYVGQVDLAGQQVTMSLNTGLGTYALTLPISAAGIPVTYTAKSVCTNSSQTVTNQQIIGWSAEPNPVAVPASGLALNGTSSSIVVNPVTLLAPGGGMEMLTYVVTWNLVPSTTTPQLVIQASGYDTWRPQAGKDEATPGNTLPIAATLRNSDGSPVTKKAAKFTFELTACSQEPGTAMNFPLQVDPSDPFDMKFSAYNNPGFTFDQYGQIATFQPSTPGLTATAVLTSYDWGGFATLKVTATLTTGETVVGYLGPDQNLTAIPIPKRSTSSKIADAWKTQFAGGVGSDDSDDENDPVGDGHRGDGFTLYEEYRGFIENGQHIEGDPAKKDLFVRDTIHAYTNGIRLFAAGSGLQVHYGLQANEFAADRVMNRNHQAGPHEVDQHGLIIVNRPDTEAAAEAHSGDSMPGSPGHIDAVWVPAVIDFRGGVTVGFGNGNVAGDASYGDIAVAHELGHSVNLYHHGDGDYDAHWSSANSGLITNEAVDGGGTNQVHVFKEATGLEVGPPTHQPLPRPMNIGVQHGQTSGDAECLMHYDVATAYKDKTDGTKRWLTSGEPVTERQLCTSPAATGTAVKRYGDAAAGRGDCVHQILVNDAITAPKR